jgi:hypothetical protein
MQAQQEVKNTPASERGPLVASFTVDYIENKQVFDLYLKDAFTWLLVRRQDSWEHEYFKVPSESHLKTQATQFACTFSYQLSSICFW